MESFLINTKTKQIDEALCNALRESDFHIREHLSDIIAEKKLTMAYRNLYSALINEENLYAGKSMIVALGEIEILNDAEACKLILSWLESNINRIVNSGIDFTNSILTKSRKAISKISSHFLPLFDEKFLEYITNMNY